jgi:D-lactate dehydrogenase (cytochrome)
MDRIFKTSGLEPYLSDESGLPGHARAIAFPRETEELQEALALASQRGEAVTVQGGRTGFCGGAVPEGGAILNLSALAQVQGFSYDPATRKGSVSVDAGLTLEQLTTFLGKKQGDSSRFDAASQESWEAYQQDRGKLWFLPNPTEGSATLGGMAASGASGSHRGGGIAGALEKLTLILPDGGIAECSRGKGAAGTELPGPEGICGTEGILGLIGGLTLSLREKPAERYGLLGFFTSYSQMDAFIRALEKALEGIPGAELLASDFFDAACASFTARSLTPGLTGYPAFPRNSAAALWVELGGGMWTPGAGVPGTKDSGEKALFAALEAALACLEACGAPAGDALAATELREFERLGSLRHGLTEEANLLDRGGSPLLADMRAPDQGWPEIAEFIAKRAGERGLGYTLMGHTGNGLVSLRLPQGGAEGRLFLDKLIPELAARGCRCSGEYGIGKIKKSQFRLLCPGEARSLGDLKKKMDPRGLINPGVLIDPDVPIGPAE